MTLSVFHSRYAIDRKKAEIKIGSGAVVLGLVYSFQFSRSSLLHVLKDSYLEMMQRC